MQLQLSKEERLELENGHLKTQLLEQQLQGLEQKKNDLLKSFCERNSQKPEDLEGVDLQSGLANFKEPEPDKKKKK